MIKQIMHIENHGTIGNINKSEIKFYLTMIRVFK